MPLAQREMLLARAMGRALAHELGHYLLASKIHTPSRFDEGDAVGNRAVHGDERSLRIEPHSGVSSRRALQANR